MPSSDAPPLVELRGIRKSYGDLLVNDDVQLSLRPGEVHALLGENGAGKSTLMRILYGLTRADAGEIRVGGSPVAVASPRDAIRLGIGMVTQHFSLVRPMTVVENVVLSGVGLGRVDLAGAREKVRAHAERVGLRVDPDRKVADLSVGEQQRVEILKALYHDCRVLVLDEPTAVLVPQDAQALFAAVRRLRDEGMGVLFTSHKLGEVTEIADRVSVLRRGRIVESLPNRGLSPRQLAELMVGKPSIGVQRGEDDAAAADQPVVLDVHGLVVNRDSGRPALDGIRLHVRAGEIVGVAGVSGNGQRELVEVLSGLRAPAAGRVRLLGHDVTGAGPAALVRAGLGRIPEDRHESLVTDLSVEANLVLEELSAHRRGPWLDRRRVRRHAEELISRYAIKASPEDPVGSLSGGNMQKVLLARVLSRHPRAVVVAQPTRGLDVGATEFVHRTLLEQRAAGAAILLISEDLEELLALCDRLVVLFEGRVVCELPVDEASPERLGLMMAGQAA